MHEDRFNIAALDGRSIPTFRWTGDSPARAVVQVAHGMGEHASRYRAALASLIDAGVTVYANEHRGHGEDARAAGSLGDYGTGGFGSLVDDMVQVTMRIMADAPGLPIILLGHSMGSFAAQWYVLDNGDLIDGLVLSGSAALDILASLASAMGASGLEAFNAPFEPARTPFDWLSRDPAEVDKYVADPLCGFSVNAGSQASLFAAAARLADPNELRKIRPDLPIYVFAGDADPLNAGLSVLTPVVDRYRAAGIGRVTTDFYAGGRHEMLNEINRDEVIANLARWIDRVVADA